MIKIHYNTTKNAHKGFTVVKMPLKHKILKKGHKKTIFLKKAKKKASHFRPNLGWFKPAFFGRLFLAGFFRTNPASTQNFILVGFFESLFLLN